MNCVSTSSLNSYSKRTNKIRLKKFLQMYPAKYYAIRDKSKAGGIFKLKVAYEDVLTEILGYSLFTINVSSANYVEEVGIKK